MPATDYIDKIDTVSMDVVVSTVDSVDGCTYCTSWHSAMSYITVPKIDATI